METMESLINLWWRLPNISSPPWPPAVLLATFLCVVGALSICYLLHSLHLDVGKHKLGGQLPPGSLGIPLLGETLQFAFFSSGPIGSPLPFFSTRLRRYGPVFKTHLMGRPTAVSMDPELSKFLLANEGRSIRAYVPKSFNKILGPTVYLHGVSHRAFRELANLSVSSNAVQKLHVDTIQEHFLACLKSWHQRSSAVLDAQKHCREWAFTYSAKYFLGLEANNPITAALMRDYFVLLNGYASIPINLPGTTYNNIVKARGRISSTIANLIRAKKKEDRKEEMDFLDILLKRTNGDGEHYSGLHVVDWVFAFVLGSYENTALLFANILKFLSENEHVVNELRREHFAIQKTNPNKAKLTWDDYRTMYFTKHVVKETLRMASITQFLFRESLEDIYFKGILIPKGWMVLLNFSMVHFSSDYYTNPLQFDPWRWMCQDSTRNNIDFLVAFGGGPRMCPGSMLVMYEASIFIHHLVTLYKWKRVHEGGKQYDNVDCLSLPIMRNGLFLRLEPLDSNKWQKEQAS
ncbi:hypothetical protein GOP47_0021873 [Adiantum capillus-veneris]|uniref:Cytochrome P450 n=1 Tax=Adiantum capillus-veneris TaxID=13818 RepID=A0A9D4Z893_ADICA|nr:hypothetical protein GOP47_0021873 [Adiantum capillus-veneris]